MPAQPTARQLMEAMLLQNNGWNQQKNIGGASDAARSRDWMNFVNSPLFNLYKGSPDAQKQMFENLYYGGGMPMQYGQTPNPTDMNRWLDRIVPGSSGEANTLPTKVRTAAQGGRPSGRSPQPSQQLTAKQQREIEQAAGAAGMNPQQLVGAFLLAAQQDFDARNAAVKKRETEIRDSKDALYDRVMGAIDNYGIAEKDNINEQFDESYNTGVAQRAARGLSNTTIDSSFQARSDRDKQRALQALSERVDERKIAHDTALSQDKQNFVERIADYGPSMQEIVSMGQMLGAAGGMAQQSPTGSPATTTAQMPLSSLPQYRPNAGTGQVMTPWGPAVSANGSNLARLNAPIHLGGLNMNDVLNAQQNAVANTVPLPQGGIDPSAYPLNRTKADYIALRNKMAANNADATAEARLRNSQVADQQYLRALRKLTQHYGGTIPPNQLETHLGELRKRYPYSATGRVAYPQTYQDATEAIQYNSKPVTLPNVNFNPNQWYA